jgi:hypothetical protein
MRHSIAGLVVIATAIVGACANPPAPTPSAGPAASPSNGPAALTVTASGMVGCATEGGCQASIDLDVVAGEPRYGEYKYAINNSFGFGGHNVALAFGRY